MVFAITCQVFELRFTMVCHVLQSSLILQFPSLRPTQDMQRKRTLRTLCGQLLFGTNLPWRCLQAPPPLQAAQCLSKPTNLLGDYLGP